MLPPTLTMILGEGRGVGVQKALKGPKSWKRRSLPAKASSHWTWTCPVLKFNPNRQRTHSFPAKKKKKDKQMLTINTSFHSFLDREFEDRSLPPHLHHTTKFLLYVI